MLNRWSFIASGGTAVAFGSIALAFYLTHPKLEDLAIVDQTVQMCADYNGNGRIAAEERDCFLRDTFPLRGLFT